MVDKKLANSKNLETDVVFCRAMLPLSILMQILQDRLTVEPAKVHLPAKVTILPTNMVKFMRRI